MQHNDDGFGNGAVRLNRTQRSARAQGHSARKHADEVSGCKRITEREAHREAVARQDELSAETLVGLLPDAAFLRVNVDDVCKQTLFLANLVGSPYVELH